MLMQERLDTFGGLRRKIKLRHFIYLNMTLKNQILFKLYYLVLDVKLLLINMNHIEIFFYRKSIDTKKLTKLFTSDIIFLSSITTCNNLLLRICCKYVVKFFCKSSIFISFFLVFHLIKNIILFIG